MVLGFFLSGWTLGLFFPLSFLDFLVPSPFPGDPGDDPDVWDWEVSGELLPDPDSDVDPSGEFLPDEDPEDDGGLGRFLPVRASRASKCAGLLD